MFKHRFFKFFFSAVLSLLFTSSASAGDEQYLKDLSLFLAGTNVSQESKLNNLKKMSEYPVFKKAMRDYCHHYNKILVRPLQAWQKKWIPHDNHDICFYPFAGADLINAYLIYPDAKTYILIGLEKGGGIPDLTKMSRTNIRKGMQMMVKGFSVFMKINFYRTIDMQWDLDHSTFIGTVPHILSQMGMFGLTPTAAYSVKMGSTGELEFTPLEAGKYSTSTALDFIDRHGEKKRVIYLKLDISDGSLSEKTNWSAWLENMGPCAGIMKAASFLLHMKEFGLMRKIVLKNMDVIVQEDSAMPYQFLKGKYDITFFGQYTGPNGLFPSRKQPDLIEAYKRSEVQPLDFPFCYNHADKTRNMQLARKKR